MSLVHRLMRLLVFADLLLNICIDEAKIVEDEVQWNLGDSTSSNSCGPTAFSCIKNVRQTYNFRSHLLSGPSKW